MKIGNTRLRSLCAMGMLALCPVLTGAQAYPNKTMRIIVPIGTGGAQNFDARLVAAMGLLAREVDAFYPALASGIRQAGIKLD